MLAGRELALHVSGDEVGMWTKALWVAPEIKFLTSTLLSSSIKFARDSIIDIT
jgi:hypothetical protein